MLITYERWYNLFERVYGVRLTLSDKIKIRDVLQELGKNINTSNGSSLLAMRVAPLFREDSKKARELLIAIEEYQKDCVIAYEEVAEAVRNSRSLPRKDCIEKTFIT